MLESFLRRRHRQAELLIVGALAEGEAPGLTMMERTGMGSGRMYVALASLERDGRIVSRWADGPYPRRRLYRLPDPADG